MTIGFWTNEIWAQSGPGFIHAEGVAFDTTAQVPYALQVTGGNYSLFASGAQILTGSLRNYSSFGTPYNLPSFVFVGDDTSSAQADVLLGSISISDVPEPATLGMLVVGLLGLAAVGSTLRGCRAGLE